jgi:hypothetical protein
LIPDPNGKYVPATTFPAATKVGFNVTLEPPKKDTDPPKVYVVMFLQRHGSYGLSPPKVCVSYILALGFVGLIGMA